jgi:hypothetical protein
MAVSPAQAMMQQFGLHQEAGRDIWLQAFAQLTTMITTANQQIAATTAQMATIQTQMQAMANEAQARAVTIADLELRVVAGPGGQPHDKTKLELSEWKSFGALDKFSGDEKSFSDWEFKFQTFVRPLKQFEAYLDWVKERDEEISVSEWQTTKGSVDLAHGAGNVKLDWYDD